MEIQIQSNIPAPTKTGKTKYPIKQMKVGDSFFLADDPTAKTPAMMKLCQICGAAYKARLSIPDWQFVTAREHGGARIWRTK